MASGYVLVGGRSSRFGSDKALHEIGGAPLVSRAVAAVQQAAGNVTLVGSPERYASLGQRVIADAFPHIGPLGGLVAALEDAGDDWCIAQSCDSPGVTAEFLRFLLCQANAECDAVLPRHDSGRMEPLCAVYCAAAAPTLRQAAAHKTYKLSQAISTLRVRWIEESDWKPFDSGGLLFHNVNRPADLAAITPQSDTLKD